MFTHRRVAVAVLGIADADLVLSGLLVHWVVKVDAVDALHPPVPPDQQHPEAQYDEQRWGTGTGLPQTGQDAHGTPPSLCSAPLPLEQCSRGNRTRSSLENEEPEASPES